MDICNDTERGRNWKALHLHEVAKPLPHSQSLIRRCAPNLGPLTHIIFSFPLQFPLFQLLVQPVERQLEPITAKNCDAGHSRDDTI